MLSTSPFAQQMLAPIALAALVAPGFAQVCPTAVIEAEVPSPSPMGNGSFGSRVAFSLDTLAVAAPIEDWMGLQDAGVVHVMTRTGSTWSEQAAVGSPAPDTDALFGFGLDVDGDVLAVGEPFADVSGADTGRVTIFERTAGVWSVQHVLEPALGNGALFGWDVAVHGDVVAVGVPGLGGSAGPDAGAAHVYLRSGNVWSLDGVLTASDGQAQGYFGYSVAFSGTTALVGAYGHGVSDEGAAYVFLRSGGGWSEQAKLIEPGAAPLRLFGFEVALDGDLAAVGAPSTSLAAPQPGSVHLFTRSGGVWSPSAELVGSNGAPLDDFGAALDLRGTRLAVSAQNNDTAYVFVQTAGVWNERLTMSAAELSADLVGPVAVDDDSLLVGAPFDVSGGIAAAGEVTAARYTNALNPSVTYCTAGTSASGCQAVLSACGIPSATATGGFVLQAEEVEGDKDGLFFFGTTGRQANPWGSGTSFQCVVPPVFRGGTLEGSGTSGACDGVTRQDLNGLWCAACPRPLKNPGAGALVQAQFWYRDPLNTSNQTTSLSAAVEFTVGP